MIFGYLSQYINNQISQQKTFSLFLSVCIYSNIKENVKGHINRKSQRKLRSIPRFYHKTGDSENYSSSDNYIYLNDYVLLRK